MALLGLLLPLVALAGGDDFFIYRTKNRPPEELVQIASGLVGHARLRAWDDKVVISGTKTEAEAAMRVFAELDRKARQYRLYVRARQSGSASREASAVEADTGMKGVQVRKRSGVLAGGAGGTVKVGGVSASAQSMASSGSGGDEQSILVTEGREASVAAFAGYLPAGAAVKVRAMGDKGVHLDIFQQNARGDHFQNAATSVDLPLGRWRDLGGARQSGTSRNGELLGGAKGASARSHAVEVKVEAMPGEGS